MRRLIRLAASVYPRWWRERYAVEFAALLEEDAANWRVATDVLSGALAMQVKTLLLGEPDWSGVEALYRNRWLLLAGCVLQGGVAAVYLGMLWAEIPIRYHNWRAAITALGYLEWAAGFAMVATGAWGWKRGSKQIVSWPLLVAALGLFGLGLIHTSLMRRPIRFTWVAGLADVVVVALCLFAVRVARQWNGAVPLIAALAVCAGVLGACALGWVHLGLGSRFDLVSLGGSFGTCTLAMTAIYCRYGLAAKS